MIYKLLVNTANHYGFNLNLANNITSEIKNTQFPLVIILLTKDALRISNSARKESAAGKYSADFFRVGKGVVLVNDL